MSRLSRLETIGPANHVISHAAGGLTLFNEPADFRFFLRILSRAVADAGFQLYDYALMSNHFHLIISQPSSQQAYSSAMKRLLHLYSLYHGEKYSRLGSLWQPRFKNFPILDDPHLLSCSAYVVLNPVRAGLVDDPAEYPWSSARQCLSGKEIPFITPSPAFLALDPSPERRRENFAKIVRQWREKPHSKDTARRFFRA